MQNVTVFYKDQAAEYFEGVIGFNGGSNTVQIQTFKGKATIIHMDNCSVTRIESDQIDDTNVAECSEDFQAWYAKMAAQAEANVQQPEVLS